MGLLDSLLEFGKDVFESTLNAIDEARLQRQLQQPYPVLISAIESYKLQGWALLTSTQFTAQLTKDGTFSKLTVSLSTDENGNVTAKETGLFGSSLIYNRPLNLKKPEEWLQLLQEQYAQQSTENSIKQISNDSVCLTVFFTSLLQMAAKIAKADGVVSKKEINALEGLFQSWELSSDQKKAAIEVFKTAKDSKTSIDEYAESCLKDSPTKEQLSSLVEVLFLIANADGSVSKVEEELILRVAKIVHYSGLDYEIIKSRYMIIDDIEKHYSTLGCTSKDTSDTIRKNYRRLASEYHPDKISHLKLPKEYEVFSHEKFRAIQDAYDSIRKFRNDL